VIDHLNLSFEIGHSCSALVDATDINRIREECNRAMLLHTEYMTIMVHLRLLGFPSIVAGAEDLRRNLDHLLDTAFNVVRQRDETIVPSERFSRKPLDKTASYAWMKVEAMRSREQLLNAARDYFSLPKDAAIDY
jgi:hypothetical protein